MAAQPGGKDSGKDREKDRARELFDQALDQAPDERAAFLARSCAGDAELRHELDSLLRLHDEAGQVLRDPTAPVTEQPGDHIGHYRLLQRIGEGGFGTVWMAEQLEPVRRMVALKVIKAGMDTAQVVARFEAERQALALMEHPNIARVFDGGATAKGRPYFVMELVRGVPITQYCDEASLSPRERLELFIPVCQAVQHAHYKGVIHRDIKPSNVLVTLHDGVPVPKVIDFGVAKATQGRLTERTLFTAFQQMIGTPEYMAPEQAELSGLDVDTRADVYSLGVLLYELLTGTRPFDLQRLLQDGYAEMLRTIKEVEPQKPSTRVSTLGDRLAEIARHRRLPPRALGPLMRGELDWIVMKTLEKERNRRYSTATALAEDVQRHLRNEPVHASPPSRIYKLRKYVQRHRIGVAVLAVIVGGTAVFLGALQSKNTELESKNVELGIATTAAREKEAEATRQAVVAQREKANVLKLSAFQTLDDLTSEAEALWPAEPALVGRYREWMRKAEELVAKLPEFRAALAEIERRALPQSAEEAGGAESDDSWWHAQMLKLVSSLEAFEDPKTGLMRGLSNTQGLGIAKRLEFAETVEERTLYGSEAKQLWSEAIESIPKSARYKEARWPGGAMLTPQLGLLPIGADPKSGLWEFAHLQSGEPARRGADGRRILAEETGLVFVLIPGGTFWMGAQKKDPTGHNYDPQALADESPVHEVTLSPYFLSKYEMTQEQWNRFTGHNPSDPGGDLTYPVTGVSWAQCMDVMSRLRLELPSEAQWEHGCRGGTETPWWTGVERESLRGQLITVDHAGGKSFADRPGSIDSGIVHTPMGSVSANPFGLHEVHGSVWEWCRDARADYLAGKQVEPVTAGTGVSRHLIRGGACDDNVSFEDHALAARSSQRNSGGPDFQVYDVGLRPARAVNPAPAEHHPQQR